MFVEFRMSFVFKITIGTYRVGIVNETETKDEKQIKAMQSLISSKQ